MAEHAKLSASGAHRWMNCPMSVQLEREFEDNGSEAAMEGTAAHALGEYKIKRYLKKRGKRPTSDYDCDDMEEHTDGYAEYVIERYEEAKGKCKDPVILIEQRLDFSRYVPDGFGTGDCLIVADRELQIIDFKYGKGVLVESEENPQMMLYALGALEIYEDLYDIETVTMTIYQPRRENISTWTIGAEALRQWATDTLMPKAKVAYEGTGGACPGEWCRFCKANVKCRARAEEKMRIAGEEFRTPPLLTDEEIGKLLGELPEVIKWANTIMDYASEAAILHGKEWPGFKVVNARSTRKFIDDDQAGTAAEKAGFPEVWQRRLMTITEMEKLMGKKRFAEIMREHITQQPGKPVLVPESDKRPAIKTVNAENEFNDEKENNENG